MRSIIALVALGTAGAANAVSFSSVAGAPDPGPAAGQSVRVSFDAANASGFVWSAGNIATSVGLLPGVAAAPAGDATRFGYVSSALVPNFATLSMPGTQSVSFYWGSIDGYNELDVLGPGGVVLATIAGGMLPPANGDQGSGITNRRVFINAGPGQSIAGLTFRSTGVAFEFDNIATGAVPEPSSWAMLIAGFALVGATARRRRLTAVSA